MEFAAYIYDALAYEQAHQGSQELSQLVDWRSPLHRASAIAIASLGLYGGIGLQPLAARNNLEPSVNTAPWCNHLYLCDTDYILEVQNLLQKRGFDVGEIDGIYGSRTKQAVIDFQRTQSPLAIDGIPGAETLRLLRQTQSANPSPSNGGTAKRPPITVRPNPSASPTSARSFSEDIGNLQILLKERGFYLGEVDGIQGQATTDAIVKAQQAYGLVQDGLLGPATIRALLAAGSDVGIERLPALVQRRSPNPQELKDLQDLLRERGFYAEANSDTYNIQIRDSVLQAQRAYKLEANGEFTPQLLVALKQQKSDSTNSAPPSNSRATPSPTPATPPASQPRPQTSASSNEPQAPISSQNLPNPEPSPPS